MENGPSTGRRKEEPMHRKGQISAIFLMALVMSMTQALAQPEPAAGTTAPMVVTVEPDFLPPSEILDFLGVEAERCRGTYEWMGPDRTCFVQIHYNDAANLLVLSGKAADLRYVEQLIRKADVPPRQIEIEVRIVEVFTSKAKDLGIDWERLLVSTRPRMQLDYAEEELDRFDRITGETGPESSARRHVTDIARNVVATGTLDLAQFLEILDESGTGTIRSAPRILTLNNRPATILDGDRVTYVTRYSSYSNIFEADSMDAGLTLAILPSLGSSGYITLEITAELTSLTSNISGSPVKSGQMLENTVIVRDGESVSLGGLTRTLENKVHKRFPVLGHILPFLFSREITQREEIESHIILTPRVVDFSAEE
jgi:type IV pilus assembly protein PilQ